MMISEGSKSALEIYIGKHSAGKWVRVSVMVTGLTECSSIQSVIIRVITKSDDRAAGVGFVYHEYDYKPNWTTRSLITN